MRQQWHDAVCTIIAATDGGLEDGVGTSSYGIWFPNEMPPILHGHAGELQPSRNASSTRQELRGQLGIEYWLDSFVKQWGVPRGQINVILITDSQASIEIMMNAHKIIGIKDTLRADMDVGLEIAAKQQTNHWFKRQVAKVESHIDEDEAPNAFYWKCNDIADTLATVARDIFTLEELRRHTPLILPGTKAGVMIRGRIVNNDLYGALREAINGQEMKEYFLNKYAWTDKTFDSIDWDTHTKQLKTFSTLKQVTVIKYIHGWLATKRRRYREGATSDNQCQLCNQEETRTHIFHCENETMTRLRETRFTTLCKELGKATTDRFQQVFTAGLSTAVGGVPPTENTKNKWPKVLLAAYEEQEKIGWEQGFLGRLSTKWDAVSEYNWGYTGMTPRPGWTKRAVGLCWAFGLELWSLRNGMIYGSGGTMSPIEVTQLRELATVLSKHRLDFEGMSPTWTFHTRSTAVEDMNPETLKAWVEQIRFLCPDRYKEIVKDLKKGRRTGVG